MANPNRASMREGPLAALFRRTEGARSNEPAERPEPDGSRLPPSPAPAAHPRESGLPHPALSASPPQVERSSPASRPRRERLRHAFSSEIPENIMDRPATHAGRAEYVREEPSPWSTPVAGQPVIRVVGVGGAGVNAVNRMVEAQVEGIEFLAINTDLQSLQQSTADITLHIGEELTRGRGSGSDANVGRQAAMEDYDRIKALLKGSDMIFITAGSGGGTGTGAAPIIARICRELGALTVAIVTKPFGFEGTNAPSRPSAASPLWPKRSTP